MSKVLCAIALAIPVVVCTQAPADSVSPRAKQLHDRAIVVDSHADTTQRLIFDKAFDIGKRNPNGNIDIPRMREGGLDALFFSIWVPSDVTGPTASVHSRGVSTRRGWLSGVDRNLVRTVPEMSPFRSETGLHHPMPRAAKLR